MDEVLENNPAAILYAADELQLNILLNHVENKLIESSEIWATQHLLEIFKTTAKIQLCEKLHKFCKKLVVDKAVPFFHSTNFTSLDHDVLKTLVKEETLAMD